MIALKKTSFFLIFVATLFLLAGCSNALNTTSQLKDDTNTLIKAAKDQNTQLKTINQTFESNRRSFNSERKTYPNENLLNIPESKTAKNVAKRKAAYQKFQEDQATIDTVSKRLVKISKQNHPNYPNQAIKNLVHITEISQLDAKHLDDYMTEAQTSETSFYADHQDPDESEADTDAAIGRLSQSYGAVVQQSEIMQVNLTTVQKAAEKVLTGLKTDQSSN